MDLILLQVYRAQESGYVLAIVHNYKDDEGLIRMEGDICKWISTH